MSDFNKNILVLLSGTTIAQALPIILMPVLTRLYSPADFGVLAIFIAVTTILGAIANARYELAITLPETDDEAITVAALGIAIASIFSLLLLIPFVLLNGTVSSLFSNEAISVWLYFVPVVVWLIGVFNVYNFLNTRLKRYKDIAISHVYRSIAMLSIQLILGFAKTGSLGLVSGQIFSQLIVTLRAGYFLPVKMIFCKIKNLSSLKVVAFRFKRFFIFMLPATLMNSLSNNFISLYLPVAFSLSTLGFYSLAQRALGAPSALIGSSIGQVYMQEASAERVKTGVVIKSFLSSLKKLTVISIIIFIPLFFIVEELFSFVFGEEWRIAGVYTKILLPFFAINFIVSSLSVTDSVMEKQYWYAIFNFTMITGLFSIFLFYKPTSVESFLYIVNAFLSISYFCYLIIIFNVSRGKL